MFQGFPKKGANFPDDDKDIDIAGSEENDSDEEYCWIGKTRGAKKTETAGNSDKLTKMLEKTCNISEKTSFKLSEKSQTPQTKTVEPQENDLLKEEDILTPIEKSFLAMLEKQEAEKAHIPVSMPPPSVASNSSAPLSPPEVINTQIFEANKDRRVTVTDVMHSQDNGGFIGFNHPFEIKRYLFESDHNRDPKPCQGQAPDSAFDSKRSCNPFPAKDALFGRDPKRSLDPRVKLPNFDTPEERDDLNLLKEQSALISSEVTPPKSGPDSKQDQNPSEVKTDPKGDSNPSQSNLHLSTSGGSEDKTLTKSSEVDNLTKSSHDEHINDDNKSFLISLLPLISSFSEIQKLQFRAGIYNLILKIKTTPALLLHQLNQISTNNIIPPAYPVGQNSAPAYQTQSKPSHDEHVINEDNRSFLMLLLPLISSFNEIQKLQFRADTYNLIIKMKILLAPLPHQPNQPSTNNILPPGYPFVPNPGPAYQTQSNMSATSNLMHGTYPSPYAPFRYLQ